MALKTFLGLLTVSLIATVANAQTISVNFHVGNDMDAEDSHVFDGTETAGLASSNTAAWNNVSVGEGGNANVGAEIFAPVTLSDDSGNASAATLTSTLVGDAVESPWFVGYAASAASTAEELTNGISDDNLFNSYLALNGPNGDGTPADSFVLDVTGLGAEFTDGGYDLIIYSDSDRRGATNNAARTSEFAVTAGGEVTKVFVEDDDGLNVDDAVLNVFDGTYVLSDGVDDGNGYSNYTVVSGLTAADFTIEITSVNGGRGAISGFQIVVGSSFLLGDVNRDGMVTFLDIAPFIDVLASNGDQAEADIDGNGVVNFFDINPFILLLSGQ